MTIGPTTVVPKVYIDWDCTNWAAAFDFSGPYDDISADVADVGPVEHGEDTEEGVAPAATCEIRLVAGPDIVAKYSPEGGGVAGTIRPWLPIRVRLLYDGTYYTKFTGFIEEIQIDPEPGVCQVTLMCTDGSDRLARQLITQDYDTRTAMTPAEAMGALLDAAGWPPGRRTIDATDVQVLSYPQTVNY